MRHREAQCRCGHETGSGLLPGCQKDSLPFTQRRPTAAETYPTSGTFTSAFGLPGHLVSQSSRSSAARHHASPAQIAIAWLLARSPITLPIPGTSSVAHLEENVTAREKVRALQEGHITEHMIWNNLVDRLYRQQRLEEQQQLNSKRNLKQLFGVD